MKKTIDKKKRTTKQTVASTEPKYEMQSFFAESSEACYYTGSGRQQAVASAHNAIRCYDPPIWCDSCRMHKKTFVTLETKLSLTSSSTTERGAKKRCFECMLELMFEFKKITEKC